MAAKKNLPTTQSPNTQVQAHGGMDPAALLQIALNSKDIDTEKMKALVEINKDVKRTQAEINFNLAMAEMKPYLPEIVRDKANTQTSSKYATIENIKTKCDPILQKYGFNYRFDEEYPDAEHIVTVVYLTHRDGHTVSARKRLSHDDAGIKGTANKTRVHAAASSGTYGQRLSLAMVLALTFKEFDNDGNAAERFLIDEDQRAKIQELIDESDTDIAVFCDHLKIASLAEMPNKIYPKAVQDLKAKIARNAKLLADLKRKEEAKKSQEGGE